MSRIEDLLSQLLVKDQATQRTLEDHATLLKNNHSSFLDLQRQVGDIARQLQERPPGQFSGNTKPNPSGSVKAISTRSGRTLGEVVRPESVEIEEEEPVDEEIEMEAPVKCNLG